MGWLKKKKNEDYLMSATENEDGLDFSASSDNSWTIFTPKATQRPVSDKTQFSLQKPHLLFNRI